MLRKGGPCARRRPPPRLPPPLPAPGQSPLERGSPLQATVMDGCGSRRFEKNSLGRCPYCLSSRCARTWRWLRQCGRNEFPLGSMGKEVFVGRVSKLYPSFCTPTKEDREEKEKKTHF